VQGLTFSKNEKLFLKLIRLYIMESITISRRMKEQRKMNLLGNDLMIFILLKHFKIKNNMKASYLKFCKCEDRKPLNDFVDYILSKIPENTYNIVYNNEKYQYYIYENNVFFTKEGEKLGTFIGEF
jgi:hypothetical protein